VGTYKNASPINIATAGAKERGVNPLVMHGERVRCNKGYARPDTC
jgi:hypothetical protein